MERRAKLMVAIPILVLVILVAIPTAYGVPLENSDVLYSAYLDWLQGKPIGLVNINVNLEKTLHNPIIVIKDYSTEIPKILYSGNFMSPTVKIERIPIGTYIENVQENGEIKQVLKTRFRPVSLLVIIADENYWGARVINFEPKEPLTKVSVEVPLHYEPVKKGVYVQGTSSIDYGTLRMNGIKTAKIRSLPGLEVSWVVERDDAISYESFSQSKSISGVPPDPDEWQSSGPTLVQDKDVWITYSVSNGNVRLVTSDVLYQISEDEICSWTWCRAIWSLVPVRIKNFHSTITGSYSGGIPSNLEREARYKSEGTNEFAISFDAPTDNEGVYFSTSISVCGGEGVQVCFTGSVDTYRESKSHYRPHYEVKINEWGSHDVLYYAYLDRDGRNYHEIFLQWG
ncbi:hypothetical protein K1720_08375 [Thermococcus argininiproducens]|uniref:Uncharacterized protein n=1 Tax=Thermococcus argininiproducens TaxID=2866384 RepID=A0A9E7M8V7_9EURY|nr:hypothetical protein [Thermococcus argininiproducens]USG99519.1 hypothetical protein K1720_08375 [Thermococcus argininiproducens]